MLPMLLGAAGGVAQTIMNQSERNKAKRRQEGKVAQMETENDVNREALQQISPEAAHRQSMADLNSAEAGAQSAALNTANNGAISGSGDVGGAGIGATKAAMASMGAATPIAQMKQQAHSDMVGQQTNKGQAIDSNIMQGAQIGDMVNYDEQDNHMDLMGGIMGGLNMATNATQLISGLSAGTEQDVFDPTKVKPPTTNQIAKASKNSPNPFVPAGKTKTPIPGSIDANNLFPGGLPTGVGGIPGDLGSMTIGSGVPTGQPIPPGIDVTNINRDQAAKNAAKAIGSPMFPNQYPPQKMKPKYLGNLMGILNPGGMFGRTP